MPAYADVFFKSPDGLSLNARRYGELGGEIAPIICLPGLTRNAADFHRFALAIQSDPELSRPVVAFSYRGRGESEWDKDWRNYTLAVELADLLAGLDILGITSAHVIGTSRGGLIAHFLHLARPELIRSVVLNDIGPVIEREGLVLIRNYLPETRSSYPTLDAAAEALRQIHGSAFPSLSDTDWAGMASAQFRRENERYFSAFDPLIAKTLPDISSDLAMPSMWDQFDALAQRPMFVIRGENSKLLSENTVQMMVIRGKSVSATTVHGQGHAPFLETGDLTLKVGRFFNQH